MAQDTTDPPVTPPTQPQVPTPSPPPTTTSTASPPPAPTGPSAATGTPASGDGTGEFFDPSFVQSLLGQVWLCGLVLNKNGTITLWTYY